jgi:hypothetical protein
LPVGHLADAPDARLLQFGNHLETRLADFVGIVVIAATGKER